MWISSSSQHSSRLIFPCVDLGVVSPSVCLHFLTVKMVEAGIGNVSTCAVKFDKHLLVFLSPYVG